jgi:Asp/Glu/hydantoin racemase
VQIRAPRIALIHALALSVDPINSAFARDWPEARRMNLLDDSLSADLAQAGGVLEPAMFARCEALADYAVGTGADAILFTCSAFGACIDAVAARHAAIPVLKPNEAMITEVSALGKRVGLIATFAPTLQQMPAEFPPGVAFDTELADGALAALQTGDEAEHTAAIVRAAQRAVDRGAQVIALAQFSMASAAPAVRAAVQVPVFTTPDSALRALQKRLAFGP